MIEKPKMNQGRSASLVSSRERLESWYAWQDSNLRPVAPEATALSI
jgi:hypothetical protein